MPRKVWYKITYHFLNVNSATFEIWKLKAYGESTTLNDVFLSEASFGLRVFRRCLFMCVRVCVHVHVCVSTPSLSVRELITCSI